MFTRLSQRGRVIVFLLTAALTVTLVTGSATPRTTYIITDGDVITTVEGYAGELDGALERAGIALSAADQVRSVREDRVVQVEIARPLTTYETELAELLPYQTVRRENPELELGQEQVVQTGRQGRVIETTRIVTDPDGTVHRSDLGRSVAEEPVDEIVEYGTRLPAVAASYLSVTSDVLTHVNAAEDGSGVLTTASGQTLRYARALTVKATAYTTERQSWKKTATGTIARVGAIAVDPKVIPYGTRMYIVSSDGTITYGVATAEDCGGSIKGNRVDLFFDTYSECINFGVRSCTVYILD